MFTFAFAVVTVGVEPVLFGAEDVGVDVDGVSKAEAEDGNVTATAVEMI